MQYSFATKTFDISGAVQIHAAATTTSGELRRRANKVQTLDGGVAINDRGFSHGDREIIISFRPESKAQNESISRLVELYDIIEVTNSEGVFDAIPIAFTTGVNESTFTVSFKQKIS